MTHEEWRDIPGYEGLYQASNLGRIRSLDREIVDRFGTARKIRGRVMRQEMGTAGYLIIRLTKDGKRKHVLVHRLIAMAFLPDDDWSLQVDHINGIRHDNRVNNLRFATPQENTDNKMRLGNKRSTVEYIPEPFDEVANLQGEEWRPVVGYEGLYEVSSMGRVKAITRFSISKNGVKRNLPEHLLEGRISNTGYREVALTDGKNNSTRKRIHRLVAEAFLEPDPERNVVDHINAVKTDNRVENLRWVTPDENVRHAIDMGNLDMDAARKKSAELNAKPVIRNDGVIYKSIKDAAKAIGVHPMTVSNVINGAASQSMGYSFRYAEGELQGGFWENRVEDLPNEEWVPIRDYEGLYCVSNMGRVKSLSRRIIDANGIEKVLPESIVGHNRSNSKRRAVSLTKDGKVLERDVCEIVAEMFIGKIDDYAAVEHVSEDESDNRLENLRYSKTKTKTPHNGRPVIRSDGRIFDSISQAARAMNVHTSAISNAVRKGYRSCGFSFRYLYEQ